MLPKYFCENCGYRSRFQVSRWSEFMGYYTLVILRCKRCGEKVERTKDVLGRVCSKQVTKESKKRKEGDDLMNAVVLINKQALIHTLEEKIINETDVRPVDMIAEVNNHASVLFDAEDIARAVADYLVSNTEITHITTKELIPVIESVGLQPVDLS